MSKKSFIGLVGLCVILAAVLYASESNHGYQSTVTQRPLLKDSDVSTVAGLKIEQGAESALLKMKDGSWVVPAKADYPADFSKIRSLLLKLVDLNVSQSVTDREDRYEGFGVSDDVAKSANGIVTFLDAQEANLFGVALGGYRKGSAKMNVMPTTGQYVRKLGEKEVFLIGEPITASASVKSWLKTDVLNVLQSKLVMIRQTKRTTAGNLEFELVHEGESSAQQSFKLTQPARAVGKELDAAQLGLVRSGLENVSLNDVFKADDPQCKDVAFDFESSYILEDGLVYRLETAQKPGSESVLLRVSATFDPQTAEKSAKAAAEKAEALKKAAAEEAVRASAEKPAGADTTPPPAAVPEVEFKPSSTDEAAQISARFVPWVYELAQYQGKKLRITLDDLIKKPEPESGKDANPKQGESNARAAVKSEKAKADMVKADIKKIAEKKPGS